MFFIVQGFIYCYVYCYFLSFGVIRYGVVGVVSGNDF